MHFNGQLGEEKEKKNMMVDLGISVEGLHVTGRLSIPETQQG